MMRASEGHHGRQRGLLLAAITAVVSGIAVFVNGYGVRAWAEISDATTYTTFKNAAAALVVVAAGGLAARRGHAMGLRRPSGVRAWLGLGVIAVAGGSVPFALFFEGLARAESDQAAFIHKTLVVWVALLAIGFLKERVGLAQVAAILLLVAGHAVMAGGRPSDFGGGELMILAATLLWSVEVVLAKRLLASVSAFTVGVARMAGGTVVLIGYGLVRGNLTQLGGVTATHWLWIAATGLLLAMYVGTWFAALSLAPAVDVTAVLVGGAIITALLGLGTQGTPLPAPAGLGLLALGVAAVLIGARGRRREPLPV